MTVAELIAALQLMPPDVEVWSFGVGVYGHADTGPIVNPVIEDACGSRPKRVIIDGGCV